MKLKSTDEDKKELINFYQNVYYGNTNELIFIEEFENKYSSDNVLWWYTRESFFYRTINLALRSNNIHMMFLLRSYIYDIQQQLQKHQFNGAITVYRSQIMSKNELDIFKRSNGQFISINSFFSASQDRLFASFMLGESNATVDWERILFEINADTKMSKTKPFADITDLSCFPNECEILFMTGSIFRVEEIFLDENQIWIVRMILCDDTKYDLKTVVEGMKKEIIKGEINLRTFANILWEMGEIKLAEKYFLRLHKQLSSNDPLLIQLYDDLAKLTSQMKKHDESMQWRQKLETFKNENPLCLAIIPIGIFSEQSNH